MKVLAGLSNTNPKDILYRMCKTVYAPSHPHTYSGNSKHCYTRCSEYIRKNGTRSITIVFVGKGKNSYHGFLMRNSRIIDEADTYKHRRLSFDGNLYTVETAGGIMDYEVVYTVPAYRLTEFCSNL